MTFGALLTMFRGTPSSVKQQIAGRFGAADTVFKSWLLSLNGVRNICAHHGRLWNRELGYKPKIPKGDARWHEPIHVSNGRVFGVLTIFKYLLDDIAPDTRWRARLGALLAEFPDVPRAPMGLPDNWLDCPIWAVQPRFKA